MKFRHSDLCFGGLIPWYPHIRRVRDTETRFYPHIKQLKKCIIPVSHKQGFLFRVFRPTNNFSFIWRRHHYLLRAVNFDLCSALAFGAFEQRRFFSVLYLLWNGTSIYMIIFDDPWHSHLLTSVWHYLFERPRSVAAGIRTPNIPLAWRTL